MNTIPPDPSVRLCLLFLPPRLNGALRWALCILACFPLLLKGAGYESLRTRPRAGLPQKPPAKATPPSVAPPTVAAPDPIIATNAVATPPPSLLPADPSAPLKPASPVAPRGDVEISSEGGFEYEGETGRVLYRNKVKVLDPANDPRTIITADWLSTILPPAGGKVGEIIAITNVVIRIIEPKGEQIARGHKAVYNATNDIITLTGTPPILEMPSGTLYGDGFVVFNRITGQFQAPGKIRMVARQGATAPLFGAGASGASTPRPSPTPSTPPRNP